ncbi:hypothetical protein DPMN_137287 [Dreissena polymorpha]|uniref:Uncharacterized protein n=1 Tax=Dreissena polymorpha TaxID=45954 RepID=A0A9D4JEK6_DREPO|nr:hypothetical protein DPMN_137287 [Dreissena polymorpha]
MPLSRAEIQRRYRERKKKESGSFLKNDRERKRKNYVTVSMLSEPEAKKRREETNKRMKKNYKKKKNANVDNTVHMENEPVTRQSTSKKGTQLTASMKFKKTRKSKKASNLNQMKSLYKSISSLKERIEKLIRTKKSLQNKLQRIESRAQQGTQSLNDELERLTPRSKTDKEMRSNGVSPRQKKTIRRKLLFLNVLQNEIKRKSIKVTVSTIEIVKKYRQMKALGKLLQKDRRTLNVKPKKIILTSKLKMKVQSFLEREDNSVTMPGKKDTVSKDKKQKKILTDYLHILHAKFCLENP